VASEGCQAVKRAVKWLDEIKAIHIIPRKLIGRHRTYLAIDISVKFLKGLASTKLLKFQLQLIALNLNSMQRTSVRTEGGLPFHSSCQPEL
jgi:hypothetical protein